MVGLLSFGGLKGCSQLESPKFKVGDCIEFNSTKESWESELLQYRVIELGKKKYRLEYVLPKSIAGELLDSAYIWDDGYKKVECAK